MTVLILTFELRSEILGVVKKKKSKTESPSLITVKIQEHAKETSCFPGFILIYSLVVISITYGLLALFIKKLHV